MRTPSRPSSPFTWLGGLIVAYLCLPLAAFVLRLVASPQRGFGVPGLFPALWVSISCATISLALVTLFGVPLAYVLARSTSRAASVVGTLVQIPLALPPLMSGVVLVYLIGPYTFLGKLFGQHLTDSLVGVVIAMSFVSAPFVIITSRAAFTSIDASLLDVAATLGHAESSRFLRVAVPTAGHGIRAGMVMAWLRGFGEYGAVVILAYNPASLPIYTYNQFSGSGLPTTLAPTALALMVAVVVVALSRVNVAKAFSHRVSVPTSLAPAPVASRPLRFNVEHRLGAFHLAIAHDSAAAHLGVLGPSGSGKSALLRCLAGLYGPGPGEVWYGDEMVQHVRVERRGVGYVAQGFSLYPHMTVWRHLLFAGATPELASYWLEHLHLNGLEARLPAELSSGQRQRVGLAQVLSRSPKVLLLDEPFSALDVPVRLELRRELRRLQRETGLATVLVTHDPHEAAFLSDELLVIAEGIVLQSGSSHSVFARPLSVQVAKLLGVENMNAGTVVAANLIDVGGALLEVPTTDLDQGTPVYWSIPPERVSISFDASAQNTSDTSSTLLATLSDVAHSGRTYDLFLSIGGGQEMVVRTWDALDARRGSRCQLALDTAMITLWPATPASGETDVTAETVRSSKPS